ncbi:MAG: hypothetical protein AB1489_27945 [Acidobacteriota bacterium]
MSVFETHKEELEKHEFMMGACRGRLAVSLDILTDALTLVGMHAVYCRSSRIPSQPKLDIEQILKNIDESKQLIQSVMQELKQQQQQ